MPSVQERPQLELLGTKTIEDADLEAALEKRDAVATRRKAVAKEFKQAHLAAIGLLETHLPESSDAEVRVGRFVVSAKSRPGGKVEFETAPSRRVWIRADGA